MNSAAVPVQVGGAEYLSEAPRTAAVLRLAAGQALPIVCESGLRPTPWARAAMAQVFLVVRCSLRLIFAFFACYLRQELEQDSDHDKQKEKEIIEIGCNHWSHRVEAMKRLSRRFSLLTSHFLNKQSLITDHVPSVRGLSLPAIDSRIDVSACTFFIRT